MEKTASDQPASGHGGVTLSLTPQDPVAGDCLTAHVQGPPSDRIFLWAVNGIEVRKDKNDRYCLEDVRRDDVVSVSVKTTAAGESASVKVRNSPPQVLDTRIELVGTVAEPYIEVTPEAQDADEDYVSFEFQWLINGVANGNYTENRLPSKAFQKEDVIQVKIIPDDGYVKGPLYQTRFVSVPSTAPVITSQPPGSFEARDYTYRVVATDPDGEPLTFTLEKAPEGMTIGTANGEITWPLSNITPGAYLAKVVVRDPGGNSAFQEFTVSLGEPKPQGQ